MSLQLLESFILSELGYSSVLDVAVSTDSRELKTGDIFVALNGPNFKGDDFVGIAADRGARAAIVNKVNTAINLPQLEVADTLAALSGLALLKRRETHARVVVITGSAGKTSVKGMLYSICQIHAEKSFSNICAESVVATKGNLNNHIGVPLTLLSLTALTQILIVEAGTSGVGEIAHLVNIIQPHISAVNNIASAHIEYFGSLKAIATEKSAVYSQSNEQCICVINLDDDFSEYFHMQSASRKIISCSSKKLSSAIVAANHIRTTKLGCAVFELTLQDNKVEVELGVIGSHNIANALVAASCAMALGVESADIALGLNQYRGIPGRMDVKTCGDCVVVDDTYNANSKSMFAAIDYLSTQKNSVLILGDMGELGDFAKNAHREVGAYAAEKGINHFYCVGEFASCYAEGFGDDAVAFISQDDLMTYLKTHLFSHAHILVKGSRSSKMENIVSLLITAAECQ